MAGPTTSIAVVRRRVPLLHMAMWGALALVALAAVVSSASVLRQPHHPVTGIVLVDGQPVEGAVVTLYPLEPPAWAYAAPAATTGPSGAFEISTLAVRRGAVIGEYAATIVWTPTVADSDSLTVARNIIPPRYARAETTPLRVIVGEGVNQLEPFQITCHCRDGLGGRFSHSSLSTNRLNQITGDSQK